MGVQTAQWKGGRALEVDRPGLEMHKNGIMVGYIPASAISRLNRKIVLGTVIDVTVTISGLSPTFPYSDSPSSTWRAPKPRSSHIPQIDVTYNVPDPVAKPAFQLLMSLREPEAEQPQPPAPASSADDDDPAADQHRQDYQLTLEVCTR